MRRIPFPVLILPAFFLFFSITSAIPAQQQLEQRPAWVLHQVAERYFRQRDFARALEMYGEALTMQPVYPEAMVGMARVHRASGDTTLARRYYRQALESAHQLVIPDEEFSIRLELAELYALSGTTEDMRLRRKELEIVVNRDPVFSGREDDRLREAMVDLLYGNGLNRVLVLYRLDFPQAREAHRRMGEMLLQSDRSQDHLDAVEHLLFAAVEVAGRAVRALIDIQFNYEFTTVERLIADAAEHPDVARYLEQADLRGILHSLADALEQSPRENGAARAAEIRRALS